MKRCLSVPSHYQNWLQIIDIHPRAISQNISKIWWQLLASPVLLGSQWVNPCLPSPMHDWAAEAAKHDPASSLKTVSHQTALRNIMFRSREWSTLAPGNPTLWRGVPVASIQKSFGSSGRDWQPWKKLPIPCKFCTYRFIRYSSTCYGKVRINPLMANIRNPYFSASPVANAAWLVVVRPCYLNRDLLSGPKGN